MTVLQFLVSVSEMVLRGNKMFLVSRAVKSKQRGIITEFMLEKQDLFSV